MVLLSKQAAVSQAIITVFETGHLDANNYSVVAVTPGDRGGLSYGKNQVTLNSGNLYFLIDRFCIATLHAEQPIYQIGAQLEHYLDRLRLRNHSINTDQTFIGLLQQAGKTEEMQKCQDKFFEDLFWNPSQSEWRKWGFTSALAAAVIYDSFVQGAWSEVCKRTIRLHGAPNIMSEQAWIAAYISTRRAWMDESSNSALRHTTYRMDAFEGLIRDGNWSLQLPLTIHEVTITEESLTASTQTDTPSDTAVTYHADATPGLPVLSIDSEEQITAEYREYTEEVQQALVSFGYPLKIDGVYSTGTAAAVGKFQIAHGLKPDQEVGPLTYHLLGID